MLRILTISAIYRICRSDLAISAYTRIKARGISAK
jgi:hypothetical protein